MNTESEGEDGDPVRELLDELDGDKTQWGLAETLRTLDWLDRRVSLAELSEAATERLSFDQIREAVAELEGRGLVEVSGGDGADEKEVWLKHD